MRCIYSADGTKEPPKFDKATTERMKREALQIAVQLPSSRAEALAVLGFAADLVEGFLCTPPLFAAVGAEGLPGPGIGQV